MHLRTFSSEGIILARRNYGEADRIVSLYTKDRGRISLLAKGIRRPKSRKRGHLEVFSHINFSASATSGIDLLIEADMREDFGGIRKSLAKVTLAYYICEVVGKVTHEGEKNPDLFNLLLDTLHKLEKTNALKDLRLSFINDLLVLLGFWPEGKEIPHPDDLIEEIIERQISSARVGKRLLN